MLTPAQSAALRQQNVDFVQRCTSYKNLLTNSGLPFSVDLSTLDKAYAEQLFTTLLTLDKGLKARYELLRTDEGKQRLLADTVSTAGHEVMDQVGAALQALTTAYRNISLGPLGWLRDQYDLEQFAKWYALELDQVLDALTIEWGSHAHVLTYFEGLAAELQRLRRLFAPLVSPSTNLEELMSAIASVYVHRGVGPAPITVDELRLHQWLLPKLQQGQVLGNIPQAA